jgi:hypothetical protein
MDKQEEKIQEDPQIAAKVGALLNKHETELTPADIDFLRARVSYIGRRSRARLAHLLTPEEKKEEPKPEDTKKPEEAPKQENSAQHPANAQQNDYDGDVE